MAESGKNFPEERGFDVEWRRNFQSMSLYVSVYSFNELSILERVLSYSDTSLLSA